MLCVHEKITVANFVGIALDALFGMARCLFDRDPEQARVLAAYVAIHPSTSAESLHAVRAMLQDFRCDRLG